MTDGTDRPRLNYKNPFCYILVGPAACGKTKIREQLMQHPTMGDAVVISTDDMVKELAIQRQKSYAEVFGWVSQAEFKRYVKRCVQEAIADNRSILVDRCNLTEKSRGYVRRLLPDHYNVVMVVMRWDEEKILQNLQDNPVHQGKTIPIDNVLNMFKVYSPPTPDEYDELVYADAVYD